MAPKKKTLEVMIKYHDDELGKIEKLPVGDWIDLRAAERVDMWTGEFKKISLGVSMKLPKGYEAYLASRSSTFEKWGISNPNGIGIIDESYCGNGDIWKFPAVAMRNTTIFKGDRICQFRIMPKMPKVQFTEVDDMEAEDRGGFGSTGKD